jgi:hypothetical protein
VEHGVETGGECGVPVPDEEAELADPFAELHGQVTGGLGDPLPGRMSGHPEDVDPAGLDFDHEEHVQAVQEDRVEVEEVAGQQPVGRGAEERPPQGVRLSGCRANPVAAQDPPHGRLTDPVAQAEEFTVHAAISPPWVLSRESADQLADLAMW